MKVLVIDDEDDIRAITTMSLGLLGNPAEGAARLTVLEANSGKQGLELAEAEQPDVILLDMIMPDMDGAATIIALRGNPKTKHIPVIFVTTKAMTTDIERMTRLGANGIITKPFDPLDLVRQVKDAACCSG